MTRRDIIAGGAASVAISMLPRSARAAGGIWRSEPDLPWPVQEVYGAFLDGQAVLVGGMVRRGDRSEAIARVAMFDPARRVWREGPALPSPRHHAAVVTVDGRLYAIGGARHGMPGEPKGEHWRQCTDMFVLSNGEWTRGPAMPAAQSEGVAVVERGRIHLMTGRTPRDPSATTWDDQRDTGFHQVFDVTTGLWSFAAPVPGARNSAGGGNIGGRLYLVGGRTMAGGNMARLDMYDPAADRWHAMRPMPASAGGLAAAVFRNRLYVFGGERLERKGPEGVIASAWCYDPSRDEWTALADMPNPRHGLAAIAMDDRILLAGGGSLPATARTTSTLQSYAPSVTEMSGAAGG